MTSHKVCIPGYVSQISLCWENFLHLGTEERYKKRQQVVARGSSSTFCYVHRGKLCSLIHSESGWDDEIRFFLDRGSLIQDTFCSLPQDITKIYPAYQVCLTDTILYRFHQSILEDQSILKQYPELLKNYIFSISLKSYMAQMQTSILRLKSNKKKIAFYIKKFWEYNNFKDSFTPPISQNQLASLLGLSSLTVNRIIHSWKKKKIIACYTKSHIKILNIEEIDKIFYS